MTVLQQIHQHLQATVDRRSNPQGLTAAHDEAVQVINLAGLATRQVLGGRRQLFGHAAGDIAHGLWQVLGQFDAIGQGHGLTFGQNAVDQFQHAVLLHQPAIRLLRDG